MYIKTVQKFANTDTGVKYYHTIHDGVTAKETTISRRDNLAGGVTSLLVLSHQCDNDMPIFHGDSLPL